MTKKAVVLLAEGFEEIEAATPVDVLRRVGVQVTVAGVGGLEIRGAHNLTYLADVKLSDAKGEFDLLVIPGGMPGARNIGDSLEAKELALRMFQAGKLVAAICAAPVMTLGAWGILSGKKATCFPGMEGMFHSDIAFTEGRVVVDGNLTTSRGPGTAMDFALALAEQAMGKDAADKVAAAMLVR